MGMAPFICCLSSQSNGKIKHKYGEMITGGFTSITENIPNELPRWGIVLSSQSWRCEENLRIQERVTGLNLEEKKSCAVPDQRDLTCLMSQTSRAVS